MAGIIPGVIDPPLPPDPTSRLLCDLLRFDDSRLSSLPEQMAAIDWRLFARLAAGYGLVGVLYGRLERLPQALAAPPAALAELRRFYLAQASLDLRRKHWLTEVLEALHARSLAVIALKGAYLAEAVYADSLDRPMVDIDLLVQLADLPGVAHALTDLGYQASKDFWLDVELGVEHQLPSFMKSGATPVEVHWCLLDPDLPFPVDLPALWQRALPAQVAGQPVRCLCPEDLLLHLCLHAATQHRFRDGLRNVYDVAATLVHFRDTLDWEALLQRAQEWQAGRALFLMFWLALELFAAPLPEGLLQKLQPPDFGPTQVELAFSLLFTQPDEQFSFPVRLAEVAQADSPWQRLRLVWRQLFLPPQEIARRYPVRPNSWKVFLYYPVRWRDLLRYRSPLAWGLLRRDPNTLTQAQGKYNRQVTEDLLIGWVLGEPTNLPRS